MSLLSFTDLVSLDRKIAVMSRDLHYVFLISGPFTDYNACLMTVFFPSAAKLSYTKQQNGENSS